MSASGQFLTGYFFMLQIKSENDQLTGGLSLLPWNVLDQLTAAQLGELDQSGVIRRFKKGDYIFCSGETSGSVYFLKSGKVKISHMVSSGKEVILWFCFAGDVFGLAESMQSGVREVNAQATEQTEVLCISQSGFKAFLFAHPQVMFLLLQVMTSRLRCLSETLANVAGEQVSKRLARLLFWLCMRYGRDEGKGVIMNVQLTHQEIADMIGATRQTVTSLINSYKREGVLTINDHVIHIVDKLKLGALLN